MTSRRFVPAHLHLRRHNSRMSWLVAAFGSLNVDFAYPLVGRRVRRCEVVQLGIRREIGQLNGGKRTESQVADTRPPYPQHRRRPLHVLFQLMR